MLKYFTSLYSFNYSHSLVCLLQISKYQIKPYFDLVNKTKDFNQVLNEHHLVKNKTTRLALLYLRLGIALQIIAGALLVYLGLFQAFVGGAFIGLALIISYPILWAYLLGVFLILNKWITSQ